MSADERSPWRNPLRPEELTERDKAVIDYCILLLESLGVMGCADVLGRRLRGHTGWGLPDGTNWPR